MMQMRRRSIWLRFRVQLFRWLASELPWMVGFVLILAGWQWLAGGRDIPGPGRVWSALFEGWQTGALPEGAWVSLRRVGVGYSFGTIFGAAVALLALRFDWIRRMSFPFIDFGRTISPLALAPLLVIWFEKGNAPPVVLIAFSVFFPTVLNWYSALSAVPDVYLRVARELELSFVSRWRQVILPAIAPAILTATRIHFGLAWIVVIAIEMFSQDDGLGSMIVKTQREMQVDHLFATVLSIAVIGAVVDLILRKWQRYPRVSWGYGS